MEKKKKKKQTCKTTIHSLFKFQMTDLPTACCLSPRRHRENHLSICSTHYNQAFSTLYRIFTDYGLAPLVRAQLLPVQIPLPMSWGIKQYCLLKKKIKLFHDTILLELADLGNTMKKSTAKASFPCSHSRLWRTGPHPSYCLPC